MLALSTYKYKYKQIHGRQMDLHGEPVGDTVLEGGPDINIEECLSILAQQLCVVKFK